MSEKLARLLARWHAKLKHWHATWHVSTFIGTLARENEKLARFWHDDTQARWHVNHAGTQACWHVDHVGTQARVARDLANSLLNLAIFCWISALKSWNSLDEIKMSVWQPMFIVVVVTSSKPEPIPFQIFFSPSISSSHLLTFTTSSLSSTTTSFNIWYEHLLFL